MVLSQKIHEAFKGTVERITGPRTVSALKEKGVLSVSEFIRAGENLVSKCPTWSWESGEPSKRKPYLPSDKQFLITRNVPCLRREVNLPSMEPLQISENKPIHSISSYFGGEQDNDIPDITDYEAQHNLIHSDPATLQTTYLVAQEPDEENILRTR